jgi:hypothetical protein
MWIFASIKLYIKSGHSKEERGEGMGKGRIDSQMTF